jgi:hypothetical protein
MYVHSNYPNEIYTYNNERASLWRYRKSICRRIETQKCSAFCYTKYILIYLVNYIKFKAYTIKNILGSTIACQRYIIECTVKKKKLRLFNQQLVNGQVTQV